MSGYTPVLEPAQAPLLYEKNGVIVDNTVVVVGPGWRRQVRSAT